jgi:GGDEF domain-containing protein
VRLGIEGFDAYSDVYGFMAADEAFGFAARCIQEVVSSKGTPNDFVGVNDNDFVVLLHDKARELEDEIKKRFLEGIKAFYSFADAERAGVILKPGTSEEKIAPLMRFNSLKALA